MQQRKKQKDENAIAAQNGSFDVEFYSMAGRAAIIPGLQYSVDRLAEILDRMRAELAKYEQPPPHERGAPQPARSRRGWPDDPEERKAEGQRRRQVAVKNKRSSGQKRYWDSLTPMQQKRHLAKMRRGRKKQGETPVVKLEAAS